MGLNNPPKKLCNECIHNPKYNCIMLKEGLRAYNLDKRDLKNVPTVKGNRIVSISNLLALGRILVQQSVLEEIATTMRGKLDNPPPPYSVSEYDWACSEDIH